MNKRIALIIFATLLGSLAITAVAQNAGPCVPGWAPQMGTPPGGPMQMRGPGMGLRGKWWNNSELVKQLGLTDVQIGQIENVFQHYRPQLMDAHSTLLQQEAVLEPLVEGEHPNVAQITAQIDKIAQSRANLEKLNAQMLLAIRQLLRADQWKQLRLRPVMRPPA